MDWINALDRIGSTAGNIIGAVRGTNGPARTVVQTPAQAQTNWTLIALIGGGVLLVIGLIFALKK